MHSSVRSKRSLICRLHPRAWLIVHLAVDLVPRPQHHAADGVADVQELLQLPGLGLDHRHVPVRRDHGIARQRELAPRGRNGEADSARGRWRRGRAPRRTAEACSTAAGGSGAASGCTSPDPCRAACPCGSRSRRRSLRVRPCCHPVHASLLAVPSASTVPLSRDGTARPHTPDGRGCRLARRDR